jgi:Spy/CpxP family protein refolding chaperone
MKLISLITLLTCVCPAFAADDSKRPADPLAGGLFRPELVLQAHDQIGLTDEQSTAIEAKTNETTQRFNDLRHHLDAENATLAALARPEHVDEAALAAQLDKVLAIEHDLKHLQLNALVTIKNLLTPAQQASLRDLIKNDSSKLETDLRQRLTGKVAQVQAGVKKWVESGRDPSAIVDAMSGQVKPLLDSGKPVEAEAELDRLLAELSKQP